ncbi:MULTISPECIES: ParB/RepB/Spo0J family partition protein [Pseudomonadaceae]|jgi:ParB family chromosome partitioning protein|uniref:DNA binding partitioning protein ParB n=3 Tax=Pseudomonadaceae TaxID=135621 RepID=Q9RLI1_PSEFL|nr:MULTISPECIES: ParB/RepB/Spo0J family partition protein [Pseudomonas]EKY1082890.1 ParB/RepB/Spo0J family partition protein [Pseudomonas aeruginosa]AFM77978.1 DNA binding partitioning protein ParB [Pseudomonas fluorescens]ASI38124.1 Putative partitioning protein ParB [Pseudomonas fluorescens]KAA6183360.1 ParB/RepB/Spo0J family partition protein [Pseudomonas veronii]MBJ2221370.1 ParB/RepB/Spo0J family partition protein [Pseudomonas sp. MF7453]
MAKSEDYPGQKKTPPLWVTGVRPPAEIAEPNLRVSVADMLAAQRAEQEDSAPVPTPVAAPTPGHSDESLAASDSGVLAEVRVESIRVSPFQPRLTFSEAAIEDLANSIASVGLVKPLTVRPIGEGAYELIGGERRWRAHKLLGRETVTAYVRSVTDAMAKILALTDNEGQEALTEYERGRSYAAIMRAGEESSIRALARRVGVNHSIVSRCLLLMDLPEEVRAILDTNPGLIGGKWAKDFIEFSRTEPALLLQAVTSMRDHQWTQEHALRWLAKEVASRDQQKTPSKFTDKEISGIGKVRVDGKKFELRCEKTVDAKRLAEQFEAFLKTIDRSLIASE